MGDFLQIQLRADLEIIFGHRLRSFDTVVTPTMNYALGTWTLTKEDERMIQSTQRKMLRLIIQTKRKYKKDSKQTFKNVIEEVGKPENERAGKDDEENLGCSEDETEDGHISNTNCDQDRDISFMNDTDEETDTAVIEEEEWIEYMKRSTDEAIEYRKNTEIQCWIKTHRRMKWRLAMRIESLLVERWVVKAAEWNPELSTQYNTCRAIGRQKEDGKMRSTNSSSLKKLKRQQEMT